MRTWRCVFPKSTKRTRRFLLVLVILFFIVKVLMFNGVSDQVPEISASRLESPRLLKAIIFNSNEEEKLLSAENNPVGVYPNDGTSPEKTPSKLCMSVTCPNFTLNAGRGKWIPRVFTMQELHEIRANERSVYKRLGLDSNGFFREDGRCGNVTVGNIFRAVCDPLGKTPCCFNNLCVERSVWECECPTCLDWRTRQSAELSEWVATNPSCQIGDSLNGDACHVLSGKRLTFFGDSTLRHMYTALLMIVSSNYTEDGLSGMPSHIRRNCNKLNMILSEYGCQRYLTRSLKVCNDTSHIQYIDGSSVNSGILPKLYPLMEGNQVNHYIIVLAGIHAEYSSQVVISEMLEPILTTIKTRAWPKLIWITSHKPGLVKPQIFLKQQDKDVLKFNKEITQFLKLYGTTVLDFYHLTSNVRSYDGTHFSFSVNVMKAQILLQHLLNKACEAT